MAAHLITFESSPLGVLVVCQCGHRAVRGSLTAAQNNADAHRVTAHPRQATYVESKRRARAKDETA